MSAFQQLIDDYVAGIQVLKQSVAGMTREQALARPIPGKWSTLEVVAHLADFEPIHADRIKRVIAEENPTLIGADETCFTKKLCYQDRDLQEDLGIVELTRKQLARILRKQPPEVLQRTGKHNERGIVTLEKLLATTTNHVNHHVQFIHEKRKALGMG